MQQFQSIKGTELVCSISSVWLALAGEQWPILEQLGEQRTAKYSVLQ